jgi:hypothetical protein
MMTYGEVEVQLNASLAWHGMKVSGKLHAPDALPLRKEPLIPNG